MAGADPGLLLDQAGALSQLRAVAIWQGGREVAARGYRGFDPDRATNIKSASKSVISALAAQQGAWGVRVHDVRATVDAVKVVGAWHG